MSAVLDQPAGKIATMESLRRGTEAPESRMPVVRMGFGDLQGFELMQRASKALAASTLVPTQFQNNMPNCLIALEMAQRIGASPLMVMQNLYIVHGRPAWSSKFLIASFNQCGRFSAVRFEWIGEKGKDTWGCRAMAMEKETQQKIEGPTITIALAKAEGWYEKSGSKWKTIPELMLMYRSAGWLVNTHAPEISMGLNTAEEIGDVFDAGLAADGTYQVTTESLRQVDKGTGEIIEQQTGGASQSEPELTVIDAIAALAKHSNEETMSLWADAELPDAVRQDDRFMKAYRAQLEEIKAAAGKK